MDITFGARSNLFLMSMIESLADRSLADDSLDVTELLGTLARHIYPSYDEVAWIRPMASATDTRHPYTKVNA